MRKVTLMAAGLALFLTGCGSSKKNVEVVDLNKVLDIFLKVMQEKDPTTNQTKAGKTPPLTNTSATAKDTEKAQDTTKSTKSKGGDATKGKVVTTAKETSNIKTVKENAAKQKKILARFATELNKAKLIKSPIGVQLATNGAVEGFTDKNKNNKMDRKDGDKRLFKIQIDEKKNRLVASDEHGYHRDHGYRHRSSGGGFFMGYMFGRMMGNQRSYYTGNRRRPNFNAMQMSPKTYHKSAASKVRSRSSGFRSRSGSGGFSFGK